MQDLRNLETIGNTIKRFEPDFDFSPVIREWASEIPKELDFRTEVRLRMLKEEGEIEQWESEKGMLARKFLSVCVKEREIE